MACADCGGRRGQISECNDCGQGFCTDHLTDHDCSSGGIRPEHLEGLQLKKQEKTNWDTGDTETTAQSKSQPSVMAVLKSKPDPQKNDNSSNGNLIAGALLLATGAMLTMSFVGAIIGIPLGILGFGVMFPRFTKAVVFLSSAVLLYLILTL